MNSHRQSERGIIKEIIVILIAVFTLNYIGFDIKDFLNSQQVKEAFDATWDLFRTVWTSYIREPLLYVWNTVVVDFLWEGWLKQFFNSK
jgi:hypothetical protein